MNKLYFNDVLNEETCLKLLNICKQPTFSYLQKTNPDHKPLILELYMALSIYLYKYNKINNGNLTNLLLKEFELCNLREINKNDDSSKLFIYFFIEEFENANKNDVFSKKINKGTLLISNIFCKFDTDNNINVIYGHLWKK